MICVQVKSDTNRRIRLESNFIPAARHHVTPRCVAPVRSSEFETTQFLEATNMRICMSFTLSLLFAVGVMTGADKSSKTAHLKPVRGITTPGIQIPMASLKPAAEIPVPARPD